MKNHEKIFWYLAVWTEGEDPEHFLLVTATDCRVSSGKMCTMWMPHGKWKTGAKKNGFHPIITKAEINQHHIATNLYVKKSFISGCIPVMNLNSKGLSFALKS